MIITACIYNYHYESKYFSVKIKDRLVFFYMQQSTIKKFGRYLYKGRFISFEYDETKKKIVEGKMAHPVINIVKIIKNRQYRQEVYYDLSNIQKGIKNLINSLNNLMFLDFELSMHDFDMPSDFVAEIIQAGIVICDKEFNILEYIRMSIKPSVFKLSRRTKKFLSIDFESINRWDNYETFYHLFLKLINRYNPNIIVWGRNDILSLKDSYELNKVPSLVNETNFINLLQLIKNYYNVKNDIGLFRAYERFTGKTRSAQSHDALEDATVTLNVFRSFKGLINNGDYKKIYFDNPKLENKTT